MSREQETRNIHKTVFDWARAKEEIREHLLEIDRHKTWWDLGYSSLYKYCECELKMSFDEVDSLLHGEPYE